MALRTRGGMLWMVVSGLCCPCFASFQERLSSGCSQTDVNGYLDRLLGDLRQTMLESGLEPVHLETYDSTFQFQIGIIVFIGQLRLDNSTLHNLSSVTRAGDSCLSYQHGVLQTASRFRFEPVQMKSIYTAKVINIGKVGEVVATIQNLTLDLAVQLHAGNLSAELTHLAISNEGWIDVDLKGNIIDELSTVLVKAITNLFRGKILSNLEQTTRTKLEQILSRIHL